MSQFIDEIKFFVCWGKTRRPSGFLQFEGEKTFFPEWSPNKMFSRVEHYCESWRRLAFSEESFRFNNSTSYSLHPIDKSSENLHRLFPPTLSTPLALIVNFREKLTNRRREEKSNLVEFHFFPSTSSSSRPPVSILFQLSTCVLEFQKILFMAQRRRQREGKSFRNSSENFIKGESWRKFKISLTHTPNKT